MTRTVQSPGPILAKIGLMRNCAITLEKFDIVLIVRMSTVMTRMIIIKVTIQLIMTIVIIIPVMMKIMTS